MENPQPGWETRTQEEETHPSSNFIHPAGKSDGLWSQPGMLQGPPGTMGTAAPSGNRLQWPREFRINDRMGKTWPKGEKKAPISAIPVGKVTDSGAAWIAYGTINAPRGNKLQGFQEKWECPELEQREGQTQQSQAPKGTNPGALEAQIPQIPTLHPGIPFPSPHHCPWHLHSRNSHPPCTAGTWPQADPGAICKH